MFICICNAVNQSRIEDAIAAGHGCVDSVYAACGVTPKCRCCADAIESIIRERQDPCFPAAAGAFAPAE